MIAVDTNLLAYVHRRATPEHAAAANVAVAVHAADVEHRLRPVGARGRRPGNLIAQAQGCSNR